MNRQLQQDMASPPFKRLTRKCHSGSQMQLSFPPINYATFNDYLYKSPAPALTISDVTHQVIPSEESYTFRRIENEKFNAICQIIPEETTTSECQTTTVEEDTPLFRKNLRKVMDIEFLAAATRRDPNLSLLINMIKQQKWDSVKQCYGPYFYNVRHRLPVRDGILLHDDRVVIPKQLRPTMMEALHLTHPGQGSMIEAAKHVWYPYLHRDSVATAQNCKNCRERILRSYQEKKHYTTLDAVVEPNEEIQLDFAGPLPNENDKEVYILVGVDHFSRFPYAKVVSNNRADTIIRFMQNHIVNHGVPRNIRCDQAQGFRA